MGISTLNMMPDKSLMIKLGQKNYRIQEALAELIDNSVDEKIPNEKLVINVRLSFEQGNPQGSEIIVEDNAAGMDESSFKDAVILGRSKKKKKLGLYGLGMKTSCINLSKKYKVVTSKRGVKEKYIFDFDEEKWLNDDDLKWENYPYEKKFEREDLHYTSIYLKDLKISKIVNTRRLENRIYDDFAFRYGMLIKNNDIEIKINGESVRPNLPVCEESTKIKFDFLLDEEDPETRVYGWVGLRWDPVAQKVVSSQVGKYGFLTYRNNRLITEWDDLKVDKETYAIRRHATWGAIIGMINMNCVPVDTDKRNFIQEHTLYIDTVKRVRPVVEEIEALIRSREGKSDVAEDIKELTEELTRAAEKSLTEEDILDLIEQNAEEGGLDNYGKITKKNISGKMIRGEEIANDDKEFRKKANKLVGSVNPSEDPPLREPRKQVKHGETREKIQKEDPDDVLDIEVEDKQMKVKHSYVDHIEGEALRSWELWEGAFIVKTNIGPILDLTGKEYPTFALHNICESLAEFCLSTQDNGKIVELRDRLIKKVYKIISTL